MFKKFVAPIVVAGLLVGGAVTATAGPASAATPATATATSGHHALKVWLKAHRRQLRKAGLAISAKAIGVSPQVLLAELKSGKSVAEVAGEHGVSSQTVVNALVSAADARVDHAVTTDRVTSTEASKIKAALPALVTRAVNHVF